MARRDPRDLRPIAQHPGRRSVRRPCAVRVSNRVSSRSTISKSVAASALSAIRKNRRGSAAKTRRISSITPPPPMVASVIHTSSHPSGGSGDPGGPGTGIDVEVQVAGLHLRAGLLAGFEEGAAERRLVASLRPPPPAGVRRLPEDRSDGPEGTGHGRRPAEARRVSWTF